MPETQLTSTSPLEAPDRGTGPDAVDDAPGDTGEHSARHLRTRIRGLGQALVFLTPGPADARRRAPWTLAIACGLGACAALLLHLFVPTAVGMGDQGDGQRLVCQLGVANQAPFDYTASTQYIYPSWVPHTWYGESCGAGGSGEIYLSSQSLILWVAKWLTPVFGLGHGVDMRVAGIVSVLLFGILLVLFTAQLPGRVGFRVLVAVCVTAVMDDGVFADFFTSPYSETSCLLGVLALLTALMFLWRRDAGVDWPGILAVGAAAAFTIAAKTQMVAVLPVVVVALFWWGRRSRRAQRSHRLHRLLSRLPALAVVVVLAAGTGAYFQSQPSRFTELNLYNAVFVEMLPHSPDPASDLKWLGLDPGWASSSGTTVASPNAAIYDANWPQFLKHVSETKIVLFYLAHPDRLVSMSDRGLDAIAHPVLGYIGSYLPGTGHPPWAKEQRFPVVQEISKVFAAVPLLIVVIQLVAFALAAAVASRRRLGPRNTALGRAVAFFIAAMWAQFWAVMLSEGESEIYKHMIVVTFMSALCLVWIVVSALILGSGAERSLHGGEASHAH